MSASLAKRILVPLLVFASVIVVVVLFYKALLGNAELTELVEQFDDVAGQHIDVTYTSTDLLAKDETVSVYVTKQDANTSWLDRKLKRKTLLFSYDPFSAEAPYPLFAESRPDHLLVFIPIISSVICQRKQVGTLSVEYQIGKMEYPNIASTCK